MDKETADRLILEYTPKLYGFALSKTRDLQKAEELAARITLEAYAALLKRDAVANPAGYIYRVAQHVYARSVREETGRAYPPSLDGVDLPAQGDFTDSLAQVDMCRQLRREITYLSAVQREVVLLHYYRKMKLEDIARHLSLPLGTVKWHLYDARSNLKKGMERMRSTGALGLQPVEFDDMGHSGSPGEKGDTRDFLQRRLTQNIAYAAYYQPKTVNEIAEELGVSPLFVADEVSILEEYGFLDRLPGDKYQTNICITVPSEEVAEETHKLYKDCTALVCEAYIPAVIRALDGWQPSNYYLPDGDRNLLLWAAVPYAMTHKQPHGGVDLSPFSVKRKDGGDYIAFAGVKKELHLSFDPQKYRVCGDMHRGPGKYPCSSRQINTCYDGRPGGWRDNLWTDYEYLYEFITGALKKEESQIEKYRRLIDKGYLVEENGGDRVNLIVIRSQEALDAVLPPFPDELVQAGKRLDAQLYALGKDRYPAHMQKLHKAMCTGCLGDGVRMYVVERLLETGVLTMPHERRKKGLTTLMFCDTLPV